jgi:hypothetical protein
MTTGEVAVDMAGNEKKDMTMGTIEDKKSEGLLGSPHFSTNFFRKGEKHGSD